MLSYHILSNVSCRFNFNLKLLLTLIYNVKISTNYVYTTTLGFLPPSGDEKLQKNEKIYKTMSGRVLHEKMEHNQIFLQRKRCENGTAFKLAN